MAFWGIDQSVHFFQVFRNIGDVGDPVNGNFPLVKVPKNETWAFVYLHFLEMELNIYIYMATSTNARRGLNFLRNTFGT